ncbi:putative antirestriction adenine methyltransferase [Histophilus somni]|uniref:putative antirestriction adenine methyltransferase n=1 Tax=Histophilus somni TaxID=731 RepID=UPI00201F66CD|nr:hypothetical protein [Histophilus somni]
MFVGSVPKQVAQQLVANVDLSKWREVNICCSGSFRIEQAIRNVSTTIPINSNDVSLITSIVGLNRVGQSTQFQFKNDLAYLNEFLVGNAETQLAVLAYALLVSKYKSDNQYCNARREFLQREIDNIIESNKERAKRYLEQIHINSFFMGDFVKHIEHAKENGNGVMIFAPTYKGGYERIYRIINENVDWDDEPSYEIYDPKKTHELIHQLRDDKMDFCFFSDQRYEDIEPTMMYEGNNKPIYIYSSEKKSSLRRENKKFRPFKYTAIKTELINEKSKVQAVVATSEVMNFLKDIYLAKGINHKNGMFNVLFYVDDMLIGGAIYSLPQFGDKIRNIYMLSDFSLSRERKLSKLVAMLATSELVIRHINKKYFINIERVHTTAFTKSPVSMKYRGIFKLDKRGDGFLNYSSDVRQGSLDLIFNEWIKKYGK